MSGLSLEEEEEKEAEEEEDGLVGCVCVSVLTRV